MKGYRERFQDLTDLYNTYDENKFNEQIFRGELDSQFEYIFKEGLWLNKLKRMREDKKKIDFYLSMLLDVKERIMDCYIKHFREHRDIEEGCNEFSPDIIIGLGCNNSLGFLDKRIERIAEISKKYNESQILLSGGGFELGGTEASLMMERLVKKYSVERERIILEEDSMDTLGNATFTKLLLKQNKKLKGIKNILIITSPFHEVRARALFKSVYGKEYKILVTGHLYHINKDEFEKRCRIGLSDNHKEMIDKLEGDFDIDKFRKKLSEQEIRALYKFNETFSNIEESLGDEVSIFYEVFLNHQIYKERYDILRKYRDVLDWWE